MGTKKLLILYLAREYGGGGVYTQRLVRSLAGECKDLHVITFHQRLKEAEREGRTIRVFADSPLGWVKVFLALARCFVKKQVGICCPADHRSVRLSVVFRTCFPSTPWIYFLQSSLHSKEDRVRMLFRRFVFVFVNAICAVSRHALESAREAGYNKRARVVECAVPGVPDSDGHGAPPVRSKPIVLLPARFVDGKGHADLLEASRGRGWEIWFAGDGEPPANIRKACNERRDVKLLGWVADMAKLYLDSTVVVLPSYSEGLSLALMEAMALGRPVVAYDIEPQRELIRHGVTGLLVPVGDREALARTIQRLLDDPGYACRLGIEAGREIQRRFTFERMGAETMNFLRQFAQV